MKIQMFRIPIEDIIPLSYRDIPIFVLEPLNIGKVPIHPGAILDVILRTNNISKIAFADRIHVSAKIIKNLCHKKQNMTAELAIRIGKAFNIAPVYWLDVQRDHDLYIARMNTLGFLMEIETYYT